MSLNYTQGIRIVGRTTLIYATNLRRSLQAQFTQYYLRSSTQLGNSQESDRLYNSPIMDRLHRLARQLEGDSSITSILSAGLFSIQPINKSINRRVLSMLYSPGVAAACTQIENHPSSVDTLTLRARSVAIVSDGSALGAEGLNVLPLMDWMITQLKYYGEIDSFPFVVRPTAPLQSVLSDLSNSYATVLYLDSKLPKDISIPHDLLVVCQEDVCTAAKCSKVDGEATARVISSLIKLKAKGRASAEQIKSQLQKNAILICKPSSYPHKIYEGDLNKESIRMHEHYQGKIEIELNIKDVPSIRPHFTLASLTKIARSKVKCASSQLSAIVTDGTAILGLGDIGPRAGLPVMEGKSLLFKVLGDVNVVPVCINKRKTPGEAVEAILDLLHSYEAINLEDFKAPECFQIEESLSQKAGIPIFHDDQHGTAIITLAALINACKLASKDPSKIKVVINGAGAAGLTIAKLLGSYGCKSIVVCDSHGAIYEGRQKNMNSSKEGLAKVTNRQKEKGKLEEVIMGADVFVGVSIKGALKKDWVAKMKEKAIIFAMANPDPEISWEDATEAGCFIYGSGRSDQINQINNSLVFPGIFRGIHEHRLESISQPMKIKAAEMIARMAEAELSRERILPDSLNRDVGMEISEGIGKLK